ncbi:MAG: class I SAM-dependent methyltransferase [Bryobacteraceae bacterium]|nr:class I SAM-dependent methyltransferase [Bryobacteraceae bacterium]MDW8378409.1 class I SAM-dependent methyltransferase [Bryobacterales bacterium]
MMNPAEFANIAALEETFWWFRGMRRILFRLLDPLDAERRPRLVLEAGCGTGYFSRELEQRYGWQMVPLDLAAEGLNYGKRLGVKRMVQGDIAAMPFAEASFDAVVSMDVLVHFPRGQEDRPFGELVRVLRPGGLLVVRVSALDILRSRHSQFAQERQRFTKGRLLELAARHRLRVLRCTYLNSLLMGVALAKFRLYEPFLSSPPESGVRPVAPWLDQLLFRALVMEEKWLGANRNFPLGQSLLLLADKPASHASQPLRG